MKTLVAIILAIQVLTMVALGVIFILRDDVRIGIAQVLLAAVTVVIYSGGVH